MTEMDRVWTRIKHTAQECAGCNEFLNSQRAESIVSTIMRDEQIRQPPREAMDFLTAEL